MRRWMPFGLRDAARCPAERMVAGVAAAREAVWWGNSSGSRSASNRLSTQNRYGQGESDCLIKTKHCDGR